MTKVLFLTSPLFWFPPPGPRLPVVAQRCSGSTALSVLGLCGNVPRGRSVPWGGPERSLRVSSATHPLNRKRPAPQHGRCSGRLSCAVRVAVSSVPVRRVEGRWWRGTVMVKIGQDSGLTGSFPALWTVRSISCSV